MSGAVGMIGATEFQPCGNCGEECSQCCGNCRKEFFCSDICQEARREQHNLICFPAKEEISGALRNCPGENKPKCVWVATRDINEGEEIFKDYPLVTGPGEKEPVPGRHVCLGCHKILDNFDEVTDERKCGDCEWPLCGDACPGADRHLKECKTLTLMRQYEPKTKFEDLVATGRAGMKKAYGIIRAVRILDLVKDKIKLQSVLKVYVHVHDQQTPEEDVRYFKSKGLVYHLSNDAMLRLLSTEYNYRRPPYYPRKDRAELVIYEKATRMDVSCMGNCYVTRISNEMAALHGIAFVAGKPIQKGERLSITCGGNPKWDGTKRRRETQIGNDGFVCNCARCSDPTELGTNVSAVKCTKCNSGFLLPLNPLDDNSKWMCNEPTCKRLLSAIDVDNIARKAQWVAGALTAAPLSEPFGNRFDFDVLYLVGEFVMKYKEILNPYHYILLNVLELTLNTWTVMIMNQNAVLPDSPPDINQKIHDHVQDLTLGTRTVMNNNTVRPDSPDESLSSDLSQKIDEHRRVAGMLFDIANRIFPPLSIPSLLAHFRVGMSNFFSAQQAVRNNETIEKVQELLKQGISHRQHIKETETKMSLTLPSEDNADRTLMTYLEEAYNNALQLCKLTPNYSGVPDNMIKFVQTLSPAAVPTTGTPSSEEEQSSQKPVFKLILLYNTD